GARLEIDRPAVGRLRDLTSLSGPSGRRGPCDGVPTETQDQPAGDRDADHRHEYRSAQPAGLADYHRPAVAALRQSSSIRRFEQGGGVSGVHLATMLVATAGLAGVLGVAAWAFSQRRDPQPWLDRGLLLSAAGALVAILSGGLLLATGARPADPLHFVYAVAELVVPLGARYLVRPGRMRRDAGVLALAAIVGLA